MSTDAKQHYGKVLADIAQDYCYSAVTIDASMAGRAALLIPHNFVNIGIYSITGRFLEGEEIESAITYALTCLAIAVADDLIDSFSNSFSQRTELGCNFIALQDYAYSRLLRTSRPIMSATLEVINRFTVDFARTCAKEVRLREANEFDLSEYLSLASIKTSLYVRYGMVLGASMTKRTDEMIGLYGNLGCKIGTAIQMIDDILDIEEDTAQSPVPITYPVYLHRHGSNMDAAKALIADQLLSAKNLCKDLPFSDQIEAVIENLQSYLSEL